MTELQILKAENAILARALKWYANTEHWACRDDWNVRCIVKAPDYGNPGGKARRALERARKVK